VLLLALALVLSVGLPGEVDEGINHFGIMLFIEVETFGRCNIEHLEGHAGRRLREKPPRMAEFRSLLI